MIWLFPIALLAIPYTGLSFLWLGLTKGKWLPDAPTKEQLMKGMPPFTYKTATHYLVNLIVEFVREDAQWWSKFFCFSLSTVSIIAIF